MIRAAALLLMLAPGSAVACACCADPGERSTITHAIQHAGDLHAAMARASKAHLFTTACGMDCIEGIANPDDLYQVTATGKAAELTLALVGPQGAGTLHLSLPGTFTSFKVDLEPEITPLTTLYVERRFAVGVTGTGAFATEWPLVGELVLSGFGNHCEDASESTHWSLDIDQVNARFRLFGNLTE